MARKNSGDRRNAVPVPEISRHVGRTTWGRLFGYYLIVAVVIGTLTHFFPSRSILEQIRTRRETALSARALFARLGESNFFPTGTPDWIDAVVQIIGALLLALPLAFVYVRTRTSQKYDQSIIQTVIMLPIVVTAILVVVQDSLALAFSLAGIVAAVRFRNNLKESGDATYIFASIGIGFAAGIHALSVAMVLSVSFVLLELGLWRVNATAEFERMFARFCAPSGADLAEIQAVARADAARPALAAPRAAPRNGTLAPASGIREQTADALADAIVPNGSRPTEKLRVHCTDLDGARPLVEALLDAEAKDWTFVTALRHPGGGGLLEYAVRPRKRRPLPELRHLLLADAGPHVIAAE